MSDIPDKLMPPPNKTSQLIEFKGTTLPIVAITLRSLHPSELAEAASALFGDDPFFDGDAAVLELSQLGDASSAKWQLVKEVLRTHGLHVIGVRGGSEELRLSAAKAGLPTYAAAERSPRNRPIDDMEPSPASPPPTVETPVVTEETESAQAAPPLAVAGPATAAPTMFVTRPLRSGQQLYARGGDLVVLAAVNAGAEVIADGSIHIYAPLHGRALAGASGAAQARIFCSRFDAQLVSVAGLYRTFDSGVPTELAGKPVQVRLTEETDEAIRKLVVEPLKTD